MKKIDFIIITILTIIAAFLRFFLIKEVPCGLFPDQALNGLDALKFSGGMFSPMLGGKEGLFIYLVSFSQIIFGTGVWQIFVVSALVGTATIITTYMAVKEFFNREIAFLSAFFLAVSSWHIALSRNGFRAILIPLIISLFAYFLIKSLKSKGKKQENIYYPLTAGIFALGFYTYSAYVIFAFSIFLISLFFIFKNRKTLKAFIKKKKKTLINSIIAFALVILPITLFVFIFPDKYFARAGEVSIFSGGKTIIEAARMFLQNFWQTFAGIFNHGDFNWRHNVSGSPLLHLFLAPFFFITFIYAIFRKREILILFFIFTMMLLPGALTNEGSIPHGLRLIGIIPILFIIPSISMSWLLKGKSKALGAACIAVLMLLTAISSYKGYFKEAPFSEHYYSDFRCDLTGAAEYIKNNNVKKVITDGFTFETIKYLVLPGEVEHELTGDYIKNFNEGLGANEKIIVLSSFGYFNEDLLNFLSSNFQEKTVKNKFGSIDFYVFSNKQ